MDLDIKNDIYDSNLFALESFHIIENDLKGNPFRWTEGSFGVIPRKEIKNVCIKFFNTINDKKIIIFIDNDSKSIKQEYSLQRDCEYILIVSVLKGDKVSFYTTPSVKTNNGDSRNLGLYVKKIFSSAQDYKTIELICFNDLNYDLYDLENLEFPNNEIQIPEISIFDQHKDVAILDLKYDKKNFQFNSSIFSFNSKKYIITRHSTFINNKITLNTLKMYEYETLNPIDLNIKDEIDFEQYEDPRVLIHDNKIYISCANYCFDNLHLIHQKMLVLDENFNHIDNIHFKYKFNGAAINKNIGKEKNWTFFVQNDKLMCVYQMYPHIVVEFTWDGEIVSEYISYFDTQSQWSFGFCRGGTNPIFKDNYYHSFFHSSTYWKNEKNRYYMGRYKFEPFPPYKIVEISKYPILWGNSIDKIIYPEKNPPVIFPCGMILEDDKFLISFGLNDEKTGMIKI
jgi:predicted GH43/DUF377 family glycosyl hydrolase